MTPQRRSRKQEARLAEQVGGKRVEFSGAGSRKGDVRSSDFLFECKTTQRASFAVKEADFRKLMRQAAVEGRTPCMQVDVGGLRLVVLRLEDMEALC